MSDKIQKAAAALRRMCDDHRPPRISVPAREDDDDIVICDALKEALQKNADIARLREERDNRSERVGELEAFIAEAVDRGILDADTEERARAALANREEGQGQ